MKLESESPRDGTKRCLTVGFLSEDWRFGLGFFGQLQTTSSAAIRLSLSLNIITFRQGRLVNAFVSILRRSIPLFLARNKISFRSYFFLFEVVNPWKMWSFIRWDFPFTAVSIASYCHAIGHWNRISKILLKWRRKNPTANSIGYVLQYIWSR